MENKKIIFFLTIFLSLNLLFSAKGLCLSEEDAQRAVKRLTNKQEEFFNRWNILNEREIQSGRELNDAIVAYNQTPSPVLLQQIDTLKIKLIENLQDQLVNDRGYIAYLELMLAELLDFDFSPLGLEGTPEDSKP
ncbi:MAG: hypothetical protein ABIH57_01510 [Candidatus Omnitrophota bacterium]